jgi:hydroxymethylpyrimidine/phosphomethylpyrimidine kinase
LAGGNGADNLRVDGSIDQTVAKRKHLPIALTIAGSDSGGGAGIQADLKTFAALGVHGTSAITCITAQNPRRVLGIEPCSSQVVRRQLEAVLAELPPFAAKTGMLYSRQVVRAVARVWRALAPRPALVVDPVMCSSSGTALLKAEAVASLQRDLLPLAALVTPNISEAERLSDLRIREVEDMRHAARVILGRFGCAVLVKGGHLSGMKQAADIFYDGKTELLVTAPFVRGIRTHGTGCTYSAAIAAYLALGRELPEAVGLAKDYITRAIVHSGRIRGHWVLSDE